MSINCADLFEVCPKILRGVVLEKVDSISNDSFTKHYPRNFFYDIIKSDSPNSLFHAIFVFEKLLIVNSRLRILHNASSQISNYEKDCLIIAGFKLIFPECYPDDFKLKYDEVIVLRRVLVHAMGAGVISEGSYRLVNLFNEMFEHQVTRIPTPLGGFLKKYNDENLSIPPEAEGTRKTVTIPSTVFSNLYWNRTSYFDNREDAAQCSDNSVSELFRHGTNIDRADRLFTTMSASTQSFSVFTNMAVKGIIALRAERNHVPGKPGILPSGLMEFKKVTVPNDNASIGRGFVSNQIRLMEENIGTLLNTTQSFGAVNSVISSLNQTAFDYMLHPNNGFDIHPMIDSFTVEGRSIIVTLKESLYIKGFVRNSTVIMLTEETQHLYKSKFTNWSLWRFKLPLDIFSNSGGISSIVFFDEDNIQEDEDDTEFSRVKNHPNISTGGSLCLGDLQRRTEGRLEFSHILQVLEFPNFDSAYDGLEEFLVDQNSNSSGFLLQPRECTDQVRKEFKENFPKTYPIFMETD